MTLSNGTPQTIPEIIQRVQRKKELLDELDRINKEYLHEQKNSQQSKHLSRK